MLRRLKNKGYLTHTVEARTHNCITAEARGAVAAEAVQQIVDRLCNGSLEELLIGMVNNAAIDPRLLQLLSSKLPRTYGGRFTLELDRWFRRLARQLGDSVEHALPATHG